VAEGRVRVAVPTARLGHAILGDRIPAKAHFSDLSILVLIGIISFFSSLGRLVHPVAVSLEGIS
jgi:hypothetical protein